MKYYDMHSHVLPGMDDGCKNLEESMNVLRECYTQGVGAIAATPHYYPKEDVASFLERRAKSYEILQEAMTKETGELPEICLGAEVAYRSGISRDPDLDKLCYGNSRFLLLELPFRSWDTEVFRDIDSMYRTRGLIPVIAHLERYSKFADRNQMNTLFGLNILIQMNAEHYLGFWSKGNAKKMLKNGYVQVMGSDCHNLDSRKPNLGIAMDAIRKAGLQEEAEYIMGQSEEIFHEAKDL